MKRLSCITLIILLVAWPTAQAATTNRVTNVNDSGPGSLRDALAGTADRIEFNIPGPGVHTITLATPLPEIRRPVIIDGYTQPKNDGSGGFASPNTLADSDDAVLLIEISGNDEMDGLTFGTSSTNSVVRGLVLNQFIRAIFFNGELTLVGANAVEGCFIGTTPNGLATKGNKSQAGVSTSRSVGNRVGGMTPAARNIISCPAGNGIQIDVNSVSNVVQGNFIGVDATGTNALGAQNNGISISGFAHNCLIGGTSAAARNIIAGTSGGFGVQCNNSTGHIIQGNFIGTDVTGTRLMSFGTPVFMGNAAFSCLIGGITATPGTPPGNVIAGGVNGGVFLSASGHVVQGNLIGTDVTGTVDLGSGNAGVTLLGAIHCTIGGTNAGAANVISGHLLDGITLSGGNTNVIHGNRIGTEITGANPLPNGGNGIGIVSSHDNVIGPGNVIAFNAGDGVNASFFVSDVNNRITANSIFSNNGLGIDLGLNGSDDNDPGDNIDGPNHLQNYPVITNAVSAGGNVTISGTLNSKPNRTFRLEFFANGACDGSGNGEGQTFLGFANITTGGSGNAGFAVTLPSAGGPVITATATDANGNTSEFSSCRAAPIPLVVTCTLQPALATNVVFGTHNPQVFLFTNGVPAPNVLVNFLITSGPNAGQTNFDETASNGQGGFPYTSNGQPGTDIIEASGSVAGQSFSCTATKVWTVVNTPPTIQCPANITTNNAPGECSRLVAFNVPATGTPAPVVICVTNETNITSPHPFRVGTTRVDCTAANAAGVTNCSFTVTVNDTEPPTVICPSNIVTEAPPGQTNVAVNFTFPTVSDNCSGVLSLTCTRAPRSSFPLGTTVVTCTARDESANTNTCSFSVTVNGCTVVTTKNDHGSGSLREAINCANAAAGPATITFNIPEGGIKALFLTNPLPVITNNSVTIDGYTQTDTMPNTLTNGDNAVINIELIGNDSFVGLDFRNAGGCVVRGLALNHFTTAIRFTSSDSTGGNANNAVEGCFIGVNASGTEARTNLGAGISISEGAGIRIGGPTLASRNLIAAGRVGILAFSTTGLLIQNNLIGTDLAGTNALGNRDEAIWLDRSTDCTIGPGNVLGNTARGILLNEGSGHLIQGNFIGTDATRTKDFGNRFGGITILNSSDNLIVGNIIAFNEEEGVAVVGTNAVNNQIMANSIFLNDALGIDLGPSGVTTNEPSGDADTGPNSLQNFPLFTNLLFSGTGPALSGTLSSGASRQYRIEFFANDACDPSSFGEGQTFLGFTNVTTDASGRASFIVSLSHINGTGFTATATDEDGNTSEFSPCFALPCRINCPVGIGTVPALNQCGATVNYDLPVAPGGCPVTCSPPPGSFFPVGSTPVTCRVTDAFGTTNFCVFPVTVHDFTPPTISGCQDLTAVAAPGEFGANVNFTVTASHPCDGILPVTCTPPAGFFALGQTFVTCEVVDSIGRRSTCRFSVTVNAPPAVGICTFGQGFYGNGNARFNGLTSFTIVSNLLAQGTLVVGKTGSRSLSIQPGDTALLQVRLPAGGASAALPADGDQTLQTATLPLNNKGRFVNALLGHTITLALNVRSTPALLSFSRLTNFCTAGVFAGPDGLRGTADDELNTNDVQTFTNPNSVQSALTDAALGINNTTVQGLLELANRALAGQPIGAATLGDIKDALEAINRAFDDCRLVVDCATHTVVLDAFNDDLSNAPVLNGTFAGGGSRSTNTLVAPPPPPSINKMVRSSNLTADKQPGEPNHAGNPGGKSVWWNWHAPRTGPAKIQTAGSSFDTLLAVYTGMAISNLALVASNDDTNGLLTSEVAFTAQAGTNYLIAVDGFDGASGNIVLTIIIDPPRLCLPVNVVGNQVQLCIAGEIGRTYVVEASPDLVNWNLIAAPLNSDGTLRFTDPARDNYRERYYRVMFEP